MLVSTCYVCEGKLDDVARVKSCEVVFCKLCGGAFKQNKLVWEKRNGKTVYMSRDGKPNF